MRNAEAIVLEKSGIRTALRKMKDMAISSIFITDKQGVLLGIVSIDKVMEFIKEERDDLASVIDVNVHAVDPNASIDDIIPLFFVSSYPVPVVDEERKLKGIIFKSTVLSGISKEGSISNYAVR